MVKCLKYIFDEDIFKFLFENIIFKNFLGMFEYEEKLDKGMRMVKMNEVFLVGIGKIDG